MIPYNQYMLTNKGVESKMQSQEYRLLKSQEAHKRWADPQWRARTMNSLNNRDSACKRNHDNVRQWAHEGVSSCEIARRVGTVPKRVMQYIRRHQLPYNYVHFVGANNPAWTGGRILDKAGYVLIYRPEHPYANSGGYVREHRLVMEGVLGRYLDPKEVVHHQDDTPAGRQNNDPSNLEMYPSNGRHLAETTTGKPHSMSPDGILAIQQAQHRRKGKKAATTLEALRTGDPGLQ